MLTVWKQHKVEIWSTLDWYSIDLVVKWFDQKVAQGDKVKAGEVLGTFDAAKIAAAGLEDNNYGDRFHFNTADFACHTCCNWLAGWRVTCITKSKTEGYPSRTGLSSPVLDDSKKCVFLEEEKDWLQICYNKYRIFFIIKGANMTKLYGSLAGGTQNLLVQLVMKTIMLWKKYTSNNWPIETIDKGWILLKIWDQLIDLFFGPIDIDPNSNTCSHHNDSKPN